LNSSAPGITRVLVTRPQPEADRLAARLKDAGIEAIVQPAQAFRSREISASELEAFGGMSPPFLLIFTSTRAVDFGLPRLPASVTTGARYAAIGPATARALAAAGKPVSVQPALGYTSEALLEELAGDSSGKGSSALIVTAPGGREVLLDRLQERDWNVACAWVYERIPVEISSEAVESIKNAERLLTVFTSGEAMNAMSQRLPPSAWFSVCRGEWLVTSERLVRLARAFGPAGIHLAKGPGNADLVTAIRSIN
jgi:uroporphyrinogen-III synthase